MAIREIQRICGAITIGIGEGLQENVTDLQCIDSIKEQAKIDLLALRIRIEYVIKTYLRSAHRWRSCRRRQHGREIRDTWVRNCQISTDDEFAVQASFRRLDGE